MKIIFSILVLFLSIVSCKKQKYCWECHATTIWRYSNGNANVFHDTTKLCDKTAKDISQYEKDGTFTKQEASQGITIVSTTSCDQQ